jgi:simple sugar transport system ATP-binding protein
VSGNGQQELMGALSGEDTRAARDSILFDGQPVGHRSSAWRRTRGMAFVPEERLGRGAVPELSLARNLLLSHQGPETVRHGWIRTGAVRRITADIIERFRVKAPGPQALAGSLSGGNLQKYIVGREVVRQPRLLVIAQPTWGVDVGAAAQIRGELLALRDAGCAILLISEELDELFELSDRLVVLAKGRLSPSIARAEATRERIGQWMSGLWPGADAAAPSAGRAVPEAVHA